LSFAARLTVCHSTLAADTQGYGRYYSCDDVTRHSDPVTALGSHRSAHGADADLRQCPRSVNWKQIKIKQFIYIFYMNKISACVVACLYARVERIKQFVGRAFFFFLANKTKAHNLNTGIYHRYLPPLALFNRPSPTPATLDCLFRCTGAEWRETDERAYFFSLSLDLSLSFSLSSFAVRWYLCQAIGQKPPIANVVFSEQCGKCTTAGHMRRSNTRPPLRSFIQK